MNRKKEAGFTLVEVLAVTIISFIAMTLIYSIISQSTATYQKQTNTNKEINDAAYALKVMTKEIRKNPNAVTTNMPNSPAELTINKGVSGKEIRFVFDKQKQIIYRNDVIFSTGIQNFEPILNGQTIKIIITNAHGKKITAELQLRKA